MPQGKETGGSDRPIDLRELHRMIREGEAKVLDVRTTTEYDSGHIEGSHNLPYQHLRGRAEEFQRNCPEPVVLVSQSGKRARKAQALLQAAGMSDVRILDQGLKPYRAAELPFPATDDPSMPDRMASLARNVRIASGAVSLAGAVLGLVRRKNMGVLAGMALGGLLVAGLSNGNVMTRIMTSLPRNSRSFDMDEALGMITRENGNAGRYTL